MGCFKDNWKRDFTDFTSFRGKIEWGNMAEWIERWGHETDSGTYDHTTVQGWPNENNPEWPVVCTLESCKKKKNSCRFCSGGMFLIKKTTAVFFDLCVSCFDFIYLFFIIFISCNGPENKDKLEFEMIILGFSLGGTNYAPRSICIKFWECQTCESRCAGFVHNCSDFHRIDLMFTRRLEKTLTSIGSRLQYRLLT